jgi:hypothetical protein
LQSGRFPWLQSFVFQDGVDGIVFDTVSKITAEPPFDAYQFEGILSAIGGLLDRCLVYRREMLDLEEKATRRALEYRLFSEQMEPQKSIELAASIEAQRNIERSGQARAAREFGKAGKNEFVANGLRETASSSSESFNVAFAAEKERKAAVTAKWVALEKYQQALEARHSTSGNALNYEQRFNRIRAFFVEDLKLAYQKIRCLEKGADKFFDIKSPLKPPFAGVTSDGIGYLDYLVLYVRDLINQVEIEKEHEIEFEHTVYLHQGRWLADGTVFIRIPDQATWISYLEPNGTGLIPFDLSQNEFPSSLSRLRISALGLSWASPDPDKTSEKLKGFSAVVFPPQALNLFSGSMQNRKPIILENFGLTDRSTKLTAYDSINNVSPSGAWRIQMSSNVGYPDITPRRRFGNDAASFKDLKLHLRLKAVASSDASQWTKFSW